MVYLDPTLMFPNPDQPRAFFNADSIRELAASIQTHGLISPIVVTRVDDAKDRIARLDEEIRQYVYEEGAIHMIVAGERRWRALCLLRQEDPTTQAQAQVIVREDLSEQDTFELSVAENVNREDMLPMEEAAAFAKLRDEYGYKPSQIAERFGRSADFVRGRLALLNLDADIQALVNGNHIPLTVAISISRLSTGRQHQVVKALNEEGLNAMEACFLSDQLHTEQTQGVMFDLGAYMHDLAATKAAEWLAKAQTVTEALGTVLEQLPLAELEAHAAKVQERIEALLSSVLPGPGDFANCPRCHFGGSCNRDDPGSVLDGEACFEERLPTLAELIEAEAIKEKVLNDLIATRKGKAITDQLRVFVLRVPTNVEALTGAGEEEEKPHHLKVVIQRGEDILLAVSVAETANDQFADILIDTDFDPGGPRWKGVTLALRNDRSYYELPHWDEYPLYEEEDDGQGQAVSED